MTHLEQLRRFISITFMRVCEARHEYLCTINGKRLLVAPHLGYQTSFLGLHRITFEYSLFLARHLIVHPGDAILEIGTGCGLIALLVSDVAARVVATDINPRAIECARENIARNSARNVETRVGDLFAPVDGERFDLIVWHLPYYSSEEVLESDSSRHFYLGGRRLITRFIHDCPLHLNEGGRVQFSLGSVEDESFLSDECARAGFNLQIVAKRSGLGFIEGQLVYLAEPTGKRSRERYALGKGCAVPDHRLAPSAEIPRGEAKC
jgi:release factor glutamine methyltransferase